MVPLSTGLDKLVDRHMLVSTATVLTFKVLEESILYSIALYASYLATKGENLIDRLTGATEFMVEYIVDKITRMDEGILKGDYIDLEKLQVIISRYNICSKLDNKVYNTMKSIFFKGIEQKSWYESLTRSMTKDLCSATIKGIEYSIEELKKYSIYDRGIRS